MIGTCEDIAGELVGAVSYRTYSGHCAVTGAPWTHTYDTKILNSPAVSSKVPGIFADLSRYSCGASCKA